jgi:HlyD family secretion protein
MRAATLPLVALCAALALSACGKKPEPKPDPAKTARAVSVVRVADQAIVGGLAAAGDLVPREEAAVAPTGTGYRVARVLTDVGQTVRQGQVLVELDASLVNAELARQRALVAQAEAQAVQAEGEARRVRGLDGQGVISDEAIEQRRVQARAMRAAANAQAAVLTDAKNRSIITSPVSGLVLSRTVRPGDLTSAAAEPWFRIARDGQIELQAQLSEGQLAEVKVGQAATITVPGGGTVVGHVRLISPQIDPTTKLGFVRILLPVRSDIRAGGFARASFGGAVASGLTVPETAVRFDADGASVMTVGADNRVKRFPVQTGQRGGGFVELVKGPPAGTRVVRSAGSLMLDGDMIRPVESAQ